MGAVDDHGGEDHDHDEDHDEEIGTDGTEAPAGTSSTQAVSAAGPMMSIASAAAGVVALAFAAL